MIKINALGDVCPIPIIKAKKALEQMGDGEKLAILVDNIIAVENLQKLCKQKNYNFSYSKINDEEFEVIISKGIICEKTDETDDTSKKPKEDAVILITSKYLGEGEEELGQALMKNFIYSIRENDVWPSTVIFYNSGVFITSKQSQMIDDLIYLEQNGVEILSCGACLDYYNLKESLKVGSITNMYTITEKLLSSKKVIKP